MNETWQDFKNDCSAEKFISNHKQTELICHTKYRYADVNWKGYVIRVDYDDNFFAKFRLSLLIKIERNDNEDPDLYLKFSDYNYNNFKHDIFNLTRGDMISYNATILFEGNERSIPILECFEFEKLNDHIFIQPHIHHSGRYSVDHDTAEIHQNDTLYREIPSLVSDDEVFINQHETDH